MSKAIKSVADPSTEDFIPQIGVFNKTFIREQIVKLSEKLAQGIHLCPLVQDDFKEFNYSSEGKQDFEKTLPDGDYRYEHKYWNDEDENIFTKTVYERFKTGEEAFF
jgi:hypothetical protein